MKFLVSLLVFSAGAAEIDERYRSSADLSIPAATMDLSLERAYSYTSGTPGLIDEHWRLNWESRMTRAGQDYIIEDMDRTSRFKRSAKPPNEYRNSFGDRLVVNANGTAQRFWGEARSDTFDSSGRLVTRSYRPSATFTLQYAPNGRLQRVSGSGGASISLTLNAKGQMTRATASTGATVDYKYDNGELVEVSVNGGPATRYGYDPLRRLIRVEHPASGAVSFHYDLKNRLTSTTYADGAEERVEYDDAKKIERRIDATGGVTEYKLAGQAVEVTDAVGRKTNSGAVMADAVSAVQKNIEMSPDASTVKALKLPNGARQEFEYDAGQRLTAIRQGGRTLTELQYNANGSIASQKRMGQPELRYEYSPDGQLKSVSTASGGANVYAYNERGKVSSVTNPAGGKTMFEYDAQERLTRKTDPVGLVTSYQYDAAGRLAQVTAPGGAATRYGYDARGRKISETDPINRVTKFEYDGDSRVSKIIHPGGRSAEYRYNPAGDLTSVTDSMGRTMTFEYDAAGRLLKQRTETGLETAREYAADGTVAAVSDSMDGRVQPRTKLNYNEFGEVTGNGAGASVAYDSEGRVSKIVEPAGNVASYLYDALGRLVEVRKPSDGIVKVSYSALGQPAEITGEMGKKSKWEYDAAGRITKATDAAARVTTYAYNEQGRLAQKKFADGRTVSYEYDLVGRIRKVDDGQFPVIYSYNPETGARVRVEYPAIRKEISYEYDRATGLRSAMIDGEKRRISYAYGTAKLPSAITIWDGSRFAFAHDAKGRVLSVTYPNAVTGSNTYNRSGQITAVSHRRGSTAIAEWSYKFDEQGNISETRDAVAGTVTAYRYDPAGQLVSESRAQGQPELRYEYAPGGNRVTAGSVRFQYDQADRLTSFGNEKLMYDDNGNLIRRQGAQRVTSYDWDAENHLIRVANADGSQIRYGYDAMGLRIWREDAKGRTWYLHDGINVISELDANFAEKAAFVHGPSIDMPLAMQRGSNRYYYHQDRQGSVAGLTDSTGRIASSYSYDAFGTQTAKTGTVDGSYAFTGREFDAATGLYFYRARYYEPKLGRFISVDPESSLATTPLELNPYLYVANNPVRHVDPLGMEYYGRENLLKWTDDLLWALTVEPDTSAADFTTARQILRERGALVDDPVRTPRQIAMDVLKRHQQTLESTNQPGYREWMGANSHDAYQEDLKTKIRAAQDNLRRLPPDPPPPGESAPRPRTPTLKNIPVPGSPRNTAALNAPAAEPPAPSAWNDPPPGQRGWIKVTLENPADGFPAGETARIKVDLPAFQPGPRPAVPNGFMKDNSPPADRLPPPRNVAGAVASGVEAGAEASWWQSIKNSNANQWTKNNPGKTMGALTGVSMTLCLWRGKTAAECAKEEAFWAAAGIAVAAVLAPIPAAVAVGTARVLAPDAKALAAAKDEATKAENQNAQQLTANAQNGGLLSQRIGKLGLDEMLARKAQIETALNGMRQKAEKAKTPLAQRLVDEIDGLETEFRNGRRDCEAIAAAERELASELSLAQRDYASFQRMLGTTKAAGLACRTEKDAANLREQIAEVNLGANALPRNVRRSSDVHNNLKSAAAKLNNLAQVAKDKLKLLDENDNELKSRQDSLDDARRDYQAAARDARYKSDSAALLHEIPIFLGALPDPLPSGTPADVIARVAKLKGVTADTFQLAGGDLAEQTPALNQLLNEATENIRKWTAEQTRLRAKIATYQTYICSPEIRKSEAAYTDRSLVEIQRLSAQSATELRDAKLDTLEATCRASGTCVAATSEAYDAIQLLELDRARKKVEEIVKDHCPSEGAIKQSLRGASDGIVAYGNGTRQAMDGCDFDSAIRIAQTFASAYPRSQSAQAASASIPKLEGWRNAKTRIAELLNQAMTAPNWATSTIALAQANALALMPCLKKMVDDAEPAIKAHQLGKTSGNTTGKNPGPGQKDTSQTTTVRDGLSTNSGTVDDPGRPTGPTRTTGGGPTTNPIPQGRPAVPMHDCEGGFHAEPNTGFATEQGRFNVQLAGQDLVPVQEVAIRARGADRILMTRVSAGRFTYTFRFQGIAGVIPITFVGKDRQGNDYCEHTIEVTSRGPRK